MDGGICSQMVQYAFGQLLKEQLTNQGINVVIKYNLSWFNENGWDLLHKNKRNFDLLKLFPTISMNTASLTEIKVYKTLYETKVQNFYDLIRINPPFCLDGYYDFPIEYYESALQSFFNLDTKILDAENRKMLYTIQQCSVSCGVHVRRGDLANNEIALKSGYSSGICEEEYFINAINIINKKN